MNKTKIEWTDLTWNVFSGCQEVSAGCAFCYAGTLAGRYAGGVAFPNGFDYTLRLHKLNEPLKIKTPSKIFVNSMSDFFWEKSSDEVRLKMIEIMKQSPRHQYQVLTKRGVNMIEFATKFKLPDNFWAGVSLENKRELHRLQELKETKAKIKFLSIEPLLEELPELDLTGIDWVIVGGESGRHLNKFSNRSLVHKVDKVWLPNDKRIDWVKKIKDNCRKYNVAFFFKQWGGFTPKACGRLLDGKEYSEFPIYN